MADRTTEAALVAAGADCLRSFGVRQSNSAVGTGAASAPCGKDKGAAVKPNKKKYID